MLLPVSVTHPDILAGTPQAATETPGCSGCPVLLALRRALQERGYLPFAIRIGEKVGLQWRLGGCWRWTELPEEVIVKMVAFDVNGRMQPFTFALWVDIEGIAPWAEPKAREPLAIGARL